MHGIFYVLFRREGVTLYLDATLTVLLPLPMDFGVYGVTRVRLRAIDARVGNVHRATHTSSGRPFFRKRKKCAEWGSACDGPWPTPSPTSAGFAPTILPLFCQSQRLTMGPSKTVLRLQVGRTSPPTPVITVAQELAFLAVINVMRALRALILSPAEKTYGKWKTEFLSFFFWVFCSRWYLPAKIIAVKKY